MFILDKNLIYCFKVVLRPEQVVSPTPRLFRSIDLHQAFSSAHREFGKDVRRLLKLVSQAILNPGIVTYI